MNAHVRALRGTGSVMALLLSAGLLVPPVAAAQVKIGYVRLSHVLNTAPQSEAAKNRIEQEFAPRDREVLAQQKNVRDLEDKLVKNGATMSDDARQKLEFEIRSRQREIQRMQSAFHEDLSLRRSQELNKLQRKITQVIQSVAKAQKFDLIMTDGVIYAGRRVDITDEVIKRLKADFKAGRN